MVHNFLVSKGPVRSAKFVVREQIQWFVTGADDKRIRIYNYATKAMVKGWEAHSDYIRYIEIHPTKPLIMRYGY